MNINLLGALICLLSMTATSRFGMAQSVNELTDGSPVTDLGGDRWTSRVFKIFVPVNQTRLTITTRGIATGREAGVTLYAKHGATPTTTVNDARSGVVGNNERISIADPKAGDWYLLLYATTAYGRVTLSADYDDAPPAPTPPPVLTAASVFSDHMVLQRNQPVPIWGTAKPGDTVTVTLSPQGPAPINPPATVATKADGNGRWRVEMAPLKASSQPMDVRITSAAGDPAAVMTDVLVGEVWVASGQSNMEWPIYKCSNGAADIAAADDSQLRLLTVPLGVSTTGPRASMPLQYNGTPSKWRLCTPANIPNFSGVAYYFARDLRKALGIPVGVIYQAMGGTTCRAWSPRSAFTGDPMVEKYLADWDARIRNWNAQWGSDPAEDVNRPMVLYDAMIAPLQPYAIQGVIWYQGESDSGDAVTFRHLFPSLIKSWRREWGVRDFPFLFVQVAPHNGWTPELREAQLQTWQTVPNTAMVVTTDVGPVDPKDFHPPNKQPVGSRLALAARALVYGESLEYSGPVYASCASDNGRVIVRFTHAAGGLKTGDGKALRGFTIAGADGVFVDAEAVIEGDSVVVSSPSVPTPKAMRYGWANMLSCNLANGEGLPASPFRVSELAAQKPVK
ncbi:MAG: pre-peptidase C-terminal domain-containing protein [Planctomycetia bacterium]|nr:pre-peptidase C-terminal domain-containing protein [Planctomycetia bacterium]